MFEFGAGKTLAQNLYMSDIIDEQVVVDLNPMIDWDRVDSVRRQLSNVVELKSDKKIAVQQDLVNYGIKYRAPYDAANTDFDDKSLDACISTNTLEHIPEESIVAIFRELIKDSGVVSANIDYSDHYAHTDKNISALNYLKFNAKDWENIITNATFRIG